MKFQVVRVNTGQPDGVSRFKITSLFSMTCVWVFGTKTETVGTSVEQRASDQLWQDYSVYLWTEILLLFFKRRSEVTIMSWFQQQQKTTNVWIKSLVLRWQTGSNFWTGPAKYQSRQTNKTCTFHSTDIWSQLRQGNNYSLNFRPSIKGPAWRVFGKDRFCVDFGRRISET